MGGSDMWNSYPTALFESGELSWKLTLSLWPKVEYNVSLLQEENIYSFYYMLQITRVCFNNHCMDQKEIIQLMWTYYITELVFPQNLKRLYQTKRLFWSGNLKRVFYLFTNILVIYYAILELRHYSTGIKNLNHIPSFYISYD